MNKVPVFFLLFLVASMVFVTIPNTVHADPQLDILVKISLNTKEHIHADIYKVGDSSSLAYEHYDMGVKETDLLIKAVAEGDAASARQHFVNAMIAFKKSSLATESISGDSQQILIPDRSQTIKKYETNIKTLKILSSKLNAGVDFDQIDQLLALAKENYAQGNFAQNENVLSEIASTGLEIHKFLYEISEQNKINRAQHFAKKHVERINELILQAKQIGLHQTANDLEESKIQLLQAKTTQAIKQQFKITIIHIQKVDQAKETHQNKFLKFEAILNSLENKAESLAVDVEVNNPANYFLGKAFNLIEEVRGDLKDLQYAPSSLRDDSKYIDLTIGNKIETIKDILIKVERLIYTSS